jgi:hypothetical protein
MKTSFSDICTGLTNIANDLEGADANNADRLLSDIQALQDRVGADTSGIGSSGANSKQ